MKDPVRLRPAEAVDYDRIIGVMGDWWGRSIQAALPRLFLDHFHETSLVAGHEGDLAGFLVGLLSPSCREDAYIHFVGVAPALRGSGVARRLYLAFHRAMGFTVTGSIADYNGPAVDRILFHRRLDA